MMADLAPSLQIDPDGRAPRRELGRWRLGWLVTNAGEGPLTVLATWLPHGRFRCERREVQPPLVLPAGGQGRLDFAVVADEAPGTVVENAFIILQTQWQAAAWRVFARLRVSFDGGGAPHPVTEELTAQRIESEM